MRSMRTVCAAWALVLWVAVVPVGAADSGRLELPKIQDTTLEGGFKVRMLERHELPLVTLLLTVRGGSAADPPGKEGLANFTGEMLRMGAGARDARAIAEVADGMGAALSSDVNRDSSQVSLQVLSRDLPAAVALLADLVVRPTFPAAEIERVRRQILAGIQDVKDDPGTAASFAFVDQLYRGHPYGHPSIGYEGSVSGVTREDIVRFHGGLYRPESAYLVAVGDFKAPELKRLLKKAFGTWSKAVSSYQPLSLKLPPVPAAVTGQQLVVVNRPGLTQTQIRIGNIGFTAGDPGESALIVANTALGGGFTSRLVEEIRVNRSLSYGASSRFSAWKLAGPFVISTFTKNETVGETLNVAFETVRAFKEKGMPPEEFHKARNFAVGRFAQDIQTSESLADWLSRIELYGLPLGYLTEYPVRLEGVTPEEENAAAARIPDENALIVLYADYERIKEQLGAYPNRRVVERLEYDPAASRP